MKIENEIISSVIAAVKELYGQDVPEKMVALQKTIPELQAEIAANERQLAQLQHKQQQLENRRSYYEKGDRRKRAHRLITRGAAIYFNFVGRFVPPAFGEVELTPEELEEIRKREERKDRLHQNYLKRKASGAQKRYEDKIKGRKKAEIEAKKAAIRAEDIAKGVFVPVSSLPQREPQKGTQIA